MGVSRTKEPYHVVMADNGHQIRLYYFSKSGDKLVGENFEKTHKFIKNLTKKIRIIYELFR